MAKDLTAALARLTEEAAGTTTLSAKALPGAKTATEIPPRVGSASPKYATGGGGIASPLTETAYANRTYHAAKTITSTDGLLTWQVDPIHHIFFTDNNNSPVEIIYKEPT